MPRLVSDMQLDEVSLVDRPANPHALLLIAKRAATVEETVPDTAEIEVFFEDGTPVESEDQLSNGDIVFAADGSRFEWNDGSAPAEPAEPVAKSFPVRTPAKPAPAKTTVFGKRAPAPSRETEIREELSKAVTEADRDDVISKALGYIAAAEAKAAEAETIAKAEQNLRLEREFVEVAKGYNVPVKAEELGPVLMRMDAALSDADCEVIHKALDTAGQMLFTELGFSGGQHGELGVHDQVEAIVEAEISKSGGALTREQALTKYYEAHPEAYDDYTAQG